jgi:ankyrin repeat protein
MNVVMALLTVPIDKESEVERASYALTYAAHLSNVQIVKQLLSTPFKSLLGTDFRYSPSVIDEAMYKAMTDRIYPIMDELGEAADMIEGELVDTGEDEPIVEDDIPRTIQDSAKREAIVWMLLDEGTENIDDPQLTEGLLLLVARCGFAEIGRRLIERDRLESWSEPSNYPLVEAARRGHKAVVKVLLDSGLFPGASSWHEEDNPVEAAAASGNCEVVKLLLDHYCVDKQSRKLDVYRAAEHARSQDVMKFLQAEGFDPSGEDASRLLYRAAQFGRHEVVKFLLQETPADPERRHQMEDLTVLARAASLGRAATVRVLLKHISDPNVQCRGGRTALSLVAGFIPQEKEKAIDTVDVLLADSRVHPESRDDEGRTAFLHAAGLPSQKRIARRLLGDLRINPDTRDDNGRTPLSWAAQGGLMYSINPTLALLMSDSRVEPDSQDNTGRTPLSWAAQGHDFPNHQKRRASTLRPSN